MIRVLLVEDHASFRQALAMTFEREPDFEVVAQAGSLAQARGMLAGADVALVDIELPDGNGLDLIPEVRGANPHGAVLVLTARTERTQLARAIEAGAAGLIHKSADIGEIIETTRRVAAGELLLSPPEVIELLRLSTRLREQERDAQLRLGQLTRREREVLQALTDGLNDAQIAERLTISVETSRTHMANILGKLGVDSRLQALVYAVRNGAVRIG